MLTTIAHAVWTMASDDVPPYVAWDGPTYVIMNGQGDQGAITFAETGVVGVFFAHESRRSPFGDVQDYDINQFFVGMPLHLRRLAEDEALQYMYEDYQGGVPVITAAFWGDATAITAVESWSDVYQHGAFLLGRVGADNETVMAGIVKGYALTPDQEALVRALYQQQQEAGAEVVHLSNKEKAALVSSGAAGYGPASKLLACIGIMMPE